MRSKRIQRTRRTRRTRNTRRTRRNQRRRRRQLGGVNEYIYPMFISVEDVLTGVTKKVDHTLFTLNDTKYKTQTEESVLNDCSRRPLNIKVKPVVELQRSNIRVLENRLSEYGGGAALPSGGGGGGAALPSGGAALPSGGAGGAGLTRGVSMPQINVRAGRETPSAVDGTMRKQFDPKHITNIKTLSDGTGSMFDYQGESYESETSAADLEIYKDDGNMITLDVQKLEIDDI